MVENEDGIQLSHEQQVCVNFTGENLVVRGEPGTGKTLILLKRAQKLLKQAGAGTPTKIHLFTFNNALSRYVAELTGEAGMQAVGVSTFHSWAIKALRSIQIYPTLVGGKAIRPIIQASIDTFRDELPEWLLKRDVKEFWDTEFSWIKGRVLYEEDEYVEVTRSGLQRLNRDARPLVWKVFQEYNRRLQQMKRMDWSDPARVLLERVDDLPLSLRINHVLIDEAQDLDLAQIKLLRAVATESLTIAADKAQKLYSTSFSWKELGINLRGRSSKTLRRSFRSTRQIIELARSLGTRPKEEEGIFPEEVGSMPMIYRLSAPYPEAGFAAKLVRDLHQRDPEAVIGVITMHQWHFKSLYAQLHDQPVEWISRGKDNDWKLLRPGIKFCTAHSAKGLEFDHVVIFRLNDGVIPQTPTEDLDEESLQEFYMGWKRLLYVAMTRSKQTLHITCSRPPSRFIEELDESLYQNVVIS